MQSVGQQTVTAASAQRVAAQSASVARGGVDSLKLQPAALRPAILEPAGYLAETMALLDNTETAKPCKAGPLVAGNRQSPAWSGHGSDDCIDFDSIPAGRLASDFTSEGFECCSISEFGTGVDLRRSGKLEKVSFVLDSWGCQKRAVSTVLNQAGRCTTKPGATFAVPITLSVYANCGPGSCPAPNINSGVGALIVTYTKTFKIPYRPSDSPKSCPNQTLNYTNYFFDPVSQLCVHGLANKITFSFSGDTQLPNAAIFTVAFNTTDHGYAPIGPKACSTTLAGCGYDSLNVIADSTGGLSVGHYHDPNGIVQNASFGGSYCDGGASGIGFLRADTPCWGPYQPQLEVTIDS